MQISIRLPVAVYSEAELAARPGTPAFQAVTGDSDRCETWEMWNTLRGMCAYSPRLTLSASPILLLGERRTSTGETDDTRGSPRSPAALDLTNPLPSPKSLTRWAAEPVRHIFLPCTSFIPNAKGYPVLSKSMQAFLKSAFKVRAFACPRHLRLSGTRTVSSRASRVRLPVPARPQFRPTVILSGTHRGLHSAGGHLAYAQYVRFLYRKAQELLPVEEYAQGYMDHLQQPLQPLMDNLEGETYEGFEKDPIKYRQYEEAVYRALLDRPQDRVTCVSRSLTLCVCSAKG